MSVRFVVSDDVPLAKFKVVYSADDSAFDADPRPTGYGSSLTVNDLQLVVDDRDNRILFASGYCPYAAWESKSLVPPLSTRGRLTAILDEELTPGVSIALTKRDSPWPIWVDADNGWVCIGDPSPVHTPRAVEFAPETIAVLRGESLAAVWLHPEVLPHGRSSSGGG